MTAIVLADYDYNTENFWNASVIAPILRLFDARIMLRGFNLPAQQAGYAVRIADLASWSQGIFWAAC